MFGIPIGLLIRVAVVAIVIGVIVYAKHLYDEHIRAPLRAEFAVKEQGMRDTIAIDERTINSLQKSVADTLGKVAAANKETDELKRAADDAERASREAIAKAVANARASRAATDVLIAKAKGPPTPGEFTDQAKEADRVLTEYASDVAKAREVLGLK